MKNGMIKLISLLTFVVLFGNIFAEIPQQTAMTPGVPNSFAKYGSKFFRVPQRSLMRTHIVGFSIISMKSWEGWVYMSLAEKENEHFLIYYEAEANKPYFECVINKSTYEQLLGYLNSFMINPEIDPNRFYIGRNVNDGDKYILSDGLLSASFNGFPIDEESPLLQLKETIDKLITVARENKTQNLDEDILKLIHQSDE